MNLNKAPAETIGKAARKAGVGVETIRFYERRGLIDQPRRPPSGGYRRYPAATIDRITFIRQAQTLGFALREIEDLLSLRADPSSDCGEVRVRAQAKLAGVTAKIANLERIRRSLEHLIARCPGQGALEACSIMDALETAPGAKPDRSVIS